MQTSRPARISFKRYVRSELERTMRSQGQISDARSAREDTLDASFAERDTESWAREAEMKCADSLVDTIVYVLNEPRVVCGSRYSPAGVLSFEVLPIRFDDDEVRADVQIQEGTDFVNEGEYATSDKIFFHHAHPRLEQAWRGKSVLNDSDEFLTVEKLSLLRSGLLILTCNVLLDYKYKVLEMDVLPTTPIDDSEVQTCMLTADQFKSLRFKHNISLWSAVACDDTHQTKFAIARGANPSQHNSNGLTALHIAAAWAAEHVFSQLVNQAAPSDLRQRTRHENWTVLHCSVGGTAGQVRSKREAVARLLREVLKRPEMGSPTDVDSSGNTVLHLAANVGDVEIIKAVLNATSSAGNKRMRLLSTTNNEKMSAVEVAVKRGNNDALIVLLQELQSGNALLNFWNARVVGPSLNRVLSNAHDALLQKVEDIGGGWYDTIECPLGVQKSKGVVELGILYHMGTCFGASPHFTNPAVTLGLDGVGASTNTLWHEPDPEVESSTSPEGSIVYIKTNSQSAVTVGRIHQLADVCGEYQECATSNIRGSSITIDLGESVRVQLSAYALQHGYSTSHGCIRSWDLLGSVDGDEWALLRRHCDDDSIQRGAQVAYWRIRGPRKRFYRFFKILMTGANNRQHHALCVGRIEIYGSINRLPRPKLLGLLILQAVCRRRRVDGFLVASKTILATAQRSLALGEYRRAKLCLSRLQGACRRVITASLYQPHFTSRLTKVASALLLQAGIRRRAAILERGQLHAAVFYLQLCARSRLVRLAYLQHHTSVVVRSKKLSSLQKKVCDIGRNPEKMLLLEHFIGKDETGGWFAQCVVVVQATANLAVMRDKLFLSLRPILYRQQARRRYGQQRAASRSVLAATKTFKVRGDWTRIWCAGRLLAGCLLRKRYMKHVKAVMRATWLVQKYVARAMPRITAVRRIIAVTYRRLHRTEYINTIQSLRFTQAACLRRQFRNIFVEQHGTNIVMKACLLKLAAVFKRALQQRTKKHKWLVSEMELGHAVIRLSMQKQRDAAAAAVPKTVYSPSYPPKGEVWAKDGTLLTRSLGSGVERRAHSESIAVYTKYQRDQRELRQASEIRELSRRLDMQEQAARAALRQQWDSELSTLQERRRQRMQRDSQQDEQILQAHYHAKSWNQRQRDEAEYQLRIAQARERETATRAMALQHRLEKSALPTIPVVYPRTPHAKN